MVGHRREQRPLENLAPTAVYVVFWVGFAFFSALVGDVFPLVSPWRAIARCAAATARHWAPRAGSAKPLELPASVGVWPAAVCLAAFGWLELCAADRDSPALLGWLAVGYMSLQLVGMSLFGIDTWARQGDGFGVLFRLLGSLAPLKLEDRTLLARRRLDGANDVDLVPGSLGLLFVVIGATTFDGAANSRAWVDASGELSEAFGDLGLAPTRASELTSTLGLIAAIVMVAAVYMIGMEGLRGQVGGTREALARRYGHTLIPIAFAYLFAHYFSLLLIQGQLTAALVSDPLGRGDDLLGTADLGVDYGLLSPSLVWYVQVAALLVGHVAALTLSHRVSLASTRRAAAVKAEYWMLVMAVAYTSLGLWLLSAIAT